MKSSHQFWNKLDFRLIASCTKEMLKLTCERNIFQNQMRNFPKRNPQNLCILRLFCKFPLDLMQRIPYTLRWEMKPRKIMKRLLKKDIDYVSWFLTNLEQNNIILFSPCKAVTVVPAIRIANVARFLMVSPKNMESINLDKSINLH